jgi:hypothetical protein
MTVATMEGQRIETMQAAREWYGRHRVDVLARLTDAPSATVERRSAALLAFAFDDDPGVVARAHAVR